MKEKNTLLIHFVHTQSHSSLCIRHFCHVVSFARSLPWVCKPLPPLPLFITLEQSFKGGNSPKDMISTKDRPVSNMAPNNTKAVKSDTKAKEKRLRIHPDELERPGIAWPTIFLAILGQSLYLYSTYQHVYGGQSSWATTALNSVALFIIFTPMHDASHASVSKDHRWLNQAVGETSALYFLGTFSVFRAVHLTHHKYVNDKGTLC